MASELAVMGEDSSISLWRNPETVLAEAQQAAKALIKVVDLKPKKVVFNNETYLEFEDWQTVAKFYGCTTKILSTNYIEYGGVKGFEATAAVLDRHQNEIGRVDSMCLSDEANWGDVPVYEWVHELDANGKKIWVEGKNGKKGYYKGDKKEVGRAPKPLFQLRSMAQTRAQVKGLRSIFSWVVVLAGYQPTPAEELTGDEFEDEGPPQEEPRKQVEMPKSKVTSEEIGGTIMNRAMGKEGTLWITLGDKVVAVHASIAGTHPFQVKAELSCLAEKKNGKSGNFWAVQKVISYKEPPFDEDPLPPMEDGTLPAKDKDSMDQKIEEGFFEEKTSGKVFGRAREIRLQTLQRNNQEKTKLTREVVHQILNNMEPAVAHLSEIPYTEKAFEMWEALMKGEEDWRNLI